MGVVYLCQPSEYSKKNILKIGKSKNNDVQLIDSKVCIILNCKDILKTIQEVRKVFHQKFTNCKGYDYFEGDIVEMKKEFTSIVSSMPKSTKPVVKRSRKSIDSSEGPMTRSKTSSVKTLNHSTKNRRRRKRCKKEVDEDYEYESEESEESEDDEEDYVDENEEEDEVVEEEDDDEDVLSDDSMSDIFEFLFKMKR